MKKLLVSDYDSTLYTNEDSMKVNLIKIDDFREKGNLFVIASGRSLCNFKKRIEHYNLKFDYLILTHGAVIYDKNIKLIKKYTIEENLVKSIIDFMNNIKRYRIVLFNSKGVNKRNNYRNVTKISIKFDSIEEAKKIEEIFREKFNNLVNMYQINNKFHYIEVISAEANKSNAIKYINNMINIPKDKIYTIGNDVNDIEMIRDYNGHAMINSKKKVFEYTSKIYRNVYELIDDII